MENPFDNSKAFIPITSKTNPKWYGAITLPYTKESWNRDLWFIVRVHNCCTTPGRACRIDINFKMKTMKTELLSFFSFENTNNKDDLI